MASTTVRSSPSHAQDRLGSQLAFANIGLQEVAKGVDRPVLQGITGVVNPGELCAILGPSGAGKTTLLNILSRRLHGDNVEGTILLDGQALTSSAAREICRVQQEDILMPSTTVRESILYSALLRLPYSQPREEKERVVDRVIDELHLNTCVTTYIGDEHLRGVSGGEKKRVSIGVELVTDPKMIYLDEPTSGLDAATASDVVNVLRELADKGRTIVCTIHQPRHDVFLRFDKVLMLCGGQEMFFGPVPQVKAYFATMGFPCPPHTYLADFLLDTIKENRGSGSGLAKEEVVQLAKRFVDYSKDSSSQANPAITYKPTDGKETVADENATPSLMAPWYYQFFVLLVRALRNIWRNPLVLASETFQYIVMAVFAGLVFLRIGNSQEDVQTRAGAIFWLLMDYAFLPSFSAASYYPKERHVFNRERSSNMYSTSAYALATALSHFPKTAVLVLLHHVISYYMFGLREGATPFFILYAISLVLAENAHALGLTVSALAPTFDSANTWLTLVALIMMMFAGFFVSNANTRAFFTWAQYSSFLKYSFEASMINEFEGRTFTCPSVPCRVGNGTLTKDNVTINVSSFYTGCVEPCYIQTGEQYLMQRDLVDRSISTNIWILVGMMVIFRLLTYLALRFVRVGKS